MKIKKRFFTHTHKHLACPRHIRAVRSTMARGRERERKEVFVAVTCTDMRSRMSVCCNMPIERERFDNERVPNDDGVESKMEICHKQIRKRMQSKTQSVLFLTYREYGKKCFSLFQLRVGALFLIISQCRRMSTKNIQIIFEMKLS